jgi:dynein heavy chain
LPIPAKFHYTFNLRDVAKVFQGILMTKSVSINSTEAFSKLWIHECSRVFYDRLINEEDRDFFRDVVLDLIKGRFKLPNMQKEEIFGKGSIIFSMLLRLDSEDKLYEEILDKNKLFKTLEDRLTDFNLSTKNKMDLVFFDDAISHICRISRILRQPRGNAMLIGVSGCGKQSLTKLSSFMLEY